MTLRQLEILTAIKECGTLTAAAERLYISQPSLSTSLKDLEQELGVVLLHRDHNGVTFTAVGEEVYLYSERILEQIREIQSIPSDEESAKNRSMTLASNFFGGTSLLAETILALQKMCQECHKYQFANTVERQPWEALVSNLIESKLDLALVAIDNFNEEKRQHDIEDSALIFEELYREPYYIVARKGHYLCGRRLTVLDLAQYLFVAEDNKVNDYIKLAYGDSYALKNTLFIESQTGLYHYLIHTDAISVMPKYELFQNNAIHGERLEILDITNFTWTRKVGYLCKKCSLDWAAELFINKLTELSKWRM